ncbi:hypothetical protein [Anaerocolumna sp.]|uniref:hypothetical protein n=1 Tax=Anaerocolumna sp. TaxID=2041569 RepID=UPI0028A8853C|nr:hypothetical protein [Anaerocolumna sp.]
MLSINASEIKNKQSSLFAANRYASSAEKNQVGNNSRQGKKAGSSAGIDSLIISTEGIGLLQGQEENDNPFLADENNLEALMESYREQLEASNDAKDGFRDMAKLMEIARRIAKGDKVPAKDEKKLMEFSPELYQAAKAAAMLHVNEKHKKHKSMFDDEEKNDIRNKLNSLEQEEMAAAESRETTAGDGVSDAEASTVE